MNAAHRRLRAQCQAQRSFLCVGLDPDLARIPAGVLRSVDPVFTFCREIVDATASHCAAFKPQIAYFAAAGAERSLERLVGHIRQNYPRHTLVLDAKRGDIGDTARQYAREAYERYDADFVTVSPYLGQESVEPYLEYKDRGLFLLCRTSNANSGLLQLHGAQPLFLVVAEWAARLHRDGASVGLVVGATQTDVFKGVRASAPNVPLLVPGVGAQGGDLAAALRDGAGGEAQDVLINSSRAILYASTGDDFAAAAAVEAERNTAQMRKL